MTAFLIFGLLGALELLIIFGFIHFLLSRKNLKKNVWLVPTWALFFGFGYSFYIFIIEGEGSLEAVGGDLGVALTTGLPFYLILFTFFSTAFIAVYAVSKIILDAFTNPKPS